MEPENHDRTTDEPGPVPRVLVVDDDPGVLTVVQKLLAHEDFDLKIAQSPLEAISIVREGNIAVIISDHSMPNMTGVELLTLVRQQSPTTACIMMTATTDMKLAEEVVNQRLVHFFVTKPWEPGRLQQIVHQALEIHRRQTQSPEAAYGEAALLRAHEHASRAAFALARAVDARDRYTHSHSERVAGLAQKVGRAMGLDPQNLEELRIGGLLHDLGKIGIPDHVLLKPGKLTEAEFHFIKMHPIIGVTITEPIDFPWSIAAIVRQHHENHDGSGYPTGIGGSDICISARIIHVVDAYEAMSADRVYRKSRLPEWIIQEFERCRGSQFDPEVTDVFLDILRRGDL